MVPVAATSSSAVSASICASTAARASAARLRRTPTPTASANSAPVTASTSAVSGSRITVTTSSDSRVRALAAARGPEWESRSRRAAMSSISGRTGSVSGVPPRREARAADAGWSADPGVSRCRCASSRERREVAIRTPARPSAEMATNRVMTCRISSPPRTITLVMSARPGSSSRPDSAGRSAPVEAIAASTAYFRGKGRAISSHTLSSSEIEPVMRTARWRRRYGLSTWTTFR